MEMNETKTLGNKSDTMIENGVSLGEIKSFVEEILSKKLQVKIRQVAIKVYKPRDIPDYKLIVLDYNKPSRWYFEQRVSRGLWISVYKDEYRIYPSFTKFFNLGEIDGWKIEDLNEYKLREVTIKHDGTLIIAFYDELINRWVFCTRRCPHFFNPFLYKVSSFDKVINVHIAHTLELEPRLKQLPEELKDYVLLFESVDKDFRLGKATFGSKMAKHFERENRVYFITARRLSDFKLLPYSESSWISKLLGIKQVEFVKVEDLGELTLRNEKIEGYVAWLEKESEVKLVKVKTRQYIGTLMGYYGLISAVVYNKVDDILPMLSAEQKKYVREVQYYVQRLSELYPKYIEYLKRNNATKYAGSKKFYSYLKGRGLVVVLPQIFSKVLCNKMSLEDAIISTLLMFKKDLKKCDRLIKKLESL